MKRIIERIKEGFTKKFFKEFSIPYIIAGLVFIVFIPVFFLGKIFFDGDTIMYTYPIAYLLGNYPENIINSFSLSGYPIINAFHIGYFHPFYKLFIIFDYINTYHIILFFDLVLAVFFSYKFFRKVGGSIYASGIGTVSYIFGQWSVVWLSSLNITHAFYLLPLLLYSTVRMYEKNFFYIFLSGVFLGLAFLGTHYQYIQLALVFNGLFFVCLFYLKFGINKKDSIKFLLSFFFSYLIGLLIGLPQILKTLNFFSLSTRSDYIVYDSVWYFDLIRYIIPSFNIQGLSVQEFLPYIGVVSLFFATIAILNYRRLNLGFYYNFFLWGFLLNLFITFKYSPLFFIVKNIPFFEYFAQPARFMYIGTFSLCVLVAFGFDYFIQYRNEILEKKWFKYFRTASLFFIVGVVFVNILYFVFGNKIKFFAQEYFRNHLYSGTIGLPLDYYNNLIIVKIDTLFHNVSLNNIDIWVLLFSLFFVYKIIKAKLDEQYISVICFSVTTLILFLPYMNKLNIVDRSFIETKPAIAEYIDSRESSIFQYRVFSYMIPFAQYQMILANNPEEDKEGYVFMREALMGNLHILSGIPIIGGYEPMAPKRYQKLLFFLERTNENSDIFDKVKELESKISILSMMNGKYVVTPYKLEHPAIKKTFETKVTKFELPLYIYENKDVLPRIYLANSVIFLRENNEDINFEIIVGSDNNFNKATFVECDFCSSLTDGVKGQVSVVKSDNQNVTIKTKSFKEEYLVFSETFVPGWEARVDGELVEIYYTNYAYQSVKIPAGEHVVEFNYKI